MSISRVSTVRDELVMRHLHSPHLRFAYFHRVLRAFDRFASAPITSVFQCKRGCLLPENSCRALLDSLMLFFA